MMLGVTPLWQGKFACERAKRSAEGEGKKITIYESGITNMGRNASTINGILGI